MEAGSLTPFLKKETELSPDLSSFTVLQALIPRLPNP